MESNGNNLNSRMGCIQRALFGLVLSTGGVLLQEPLLSLTLNKRPDKMSIFLPVYAYFLLNPLTLYLNMFLLFLLHANQHAAVFLRKNLPRAAQTVSSFTLLFAAPLWAQAAITYESISFAVGAMLLCIALASILASVSMKLLITYCDADAEFELGLFSLITYCDAIFALSVAFAVLSVAVYMKLFVAVADITAINWC